MILLAITPGLGFNRGTWRKVLLAGVDGFLIREKSLPARLLLDAARWCQDTAPGVRLWVAGRLDVAVAAGIGLHAPEAHPEVEPGLVPISRPLHEEAQWETRRAADQLLISPVLASPGKGVPWEPERLHRFLERLPEAQASLLALGGITRANAAATLTAGAAGVAAIRLFLQ